MYGERIKLLRKDYKTTQADLAEHLGFKGPSAIGMVERNERELSFEMLSKIATYFHVSTDYLIGKTEMVVCPECGSMYSPLYIESCEEHEITHNNYLNFKEKNKLLDYYDIEKIKEECRLIFKSKDLSSDKKYNTALEYFKCYFTRSVVASDYSPNHVNFNDFVAMLLNQKRGLAKSIPIDIFNILVSQFGKKDGIPDGESYGPLKIINRENTKEEVILLSNYEILNDTGKEKLIEYSNDLIETPKYVEKTKVIDLITATKEKLEAKPHLMPIASHDKEGNFTAEDYKHDDDIMNDDDFWNK
ncbi:HTH-type transcriptional regulator Xre [Clostridium puniceum]|uniref:HTH-type transcriptional regulator Xre n=1 Tax=Clostridium puniceum TaxID=29367 RepID=A0A1S8TBX6_9CLOT|nr:helix-turn-helix transcriptional regulator [Clostridium puniceum]OOM75114.1 HTH-type transcriptional regulator Xre [Clostridium puniceum]